MIYAADQWVSTDWDYALAFYAGLTKTRARQGRPEWRSSFHASTMAVPAVDSRTPGAPAS